MNRDARVAQHSILARINYAIPMLFPCNYITFYSGQKSCDPESCGPNHADPCRADRPHKPGGPEPTCPCQHRSSKHSKYCYLMFVAVWLLRLTSNLRRIFDDISMRQRSEHLKCKLEFRTRAKCRVPGTSTSGEARARVSLGCRRHQTLTGRPVPGFWILLGGWWFGASNQGPESSFWLWNAWPRHAQKECFHRHRYDITSIAACLRAVGRPGQARHKLELEWELEQRRLEKAPRKATGGKRETLRATYKDA